jgi:hypothetical protein
MAKVKPVMERKLAEIEAAAQQLMELQSRLAMLEVKFREKWCVSAWGEVVVSSLP